MMLKKVNAKFPREGKIAFHCISFLCCRKFCCHHIKLIAMPDIRMLFKTRNFRLSLLSPLEIWIYCAIRTICSLFFQHSPITKSIECTWILNENKIDFLFFLYILNNGGSYFFKFLIPSVWNFSKSVWLRKWHHNFRIIYRKNSKETCFLITT